MTCCTKKGANIKKRKGRTGDPALPHVSVFQTISAFGETGIDAENLLHLHAVLEVEDNEITF